MRGMARRGTKLGEVHPDDWDMFSDAAFLIDHPGWSWRDLQDAPDEVVEIIRKYDSTEVKRG